MLIFLSMILNAGADEKLRALAPSRTQFGLIAQKEDALNILPVLEAADPGHTPLFPLAVYSLGKIDATDKLVAR